jgi:uncharacterized repeat protein (TIGR02543 family)
MTVPVTDPSHVLVLNGQVITTAPNVLGTYVITILHWSGITSTFTINVHQTVINFNSNGGNGGPVSAPVILGQLLPAITTAPTRTGYHFTGYWDEATGGTEYYSANLTSSKDTWDKIGNITLYAHWSSGTIHNIVFHSNNVSQQTATQQIHENTQTTLRTNTFIRAGYAFAGWAVTPTESVEYADGAAYITGEGTVTLNLYAKWDLTLNIGDTGPGGGIIYYKNEAGFTVQMVNPAQNYVAHYLEVAPNNAVSTASWGDDLYDTFVPGITTATGNTYTSILGSDYIGVGRKDTQLIVNQFPNRHLVAAYICVNYSGGGLKDWFLPSLAELRQLTLSSVSSIMTGFNWSSSQESENYAWRIYYIGDGYGWNYSREVKVSNGRTVRPVRAF